MVPGSLLRDSGNEQAEAKRLVSRFVTLFVDATDFKEAQLRDATGEIFGGDLQAARS